MKILRDTLNKIDANIILAELSDDQLHNKMTCLSKPEYPEVIIPYCMENNKSIYPFQPNTEEGMNYGKKKDAILKRLKQNDIDKSKFETNETIASIYANQFMLKCDDLKVLQSEMFDNFFRADYELTKTLFPQLGELREFWNRSFYKEIDRKLEVNRDVDRILITVGLSHKFWLKEQLLQRDDINYKEIGDFL
jgi:hypothetical protein